MQGLIARRCAGSILAALVLTHCAELPTKPAVVSARPGQPAPVATPPPQAATEAAAAFPALERYVDGIGQRLAKTSGYRAHWKFSVTDQSELLAWSLPDGTVRLSRGFIARLNSEAELAAALAREIALVSMRRARPGTLVPGLPGLLGPTPEFDSRGRFAHPADESGDIAARAARYLVETGYEPRALLAVTGRANEVRQRVVELARRSGGADYRVAREEFLAQLDGLPWGDAPALGRLDGNTLHHDGLDLAFTFPAGWSIQREPGRVAAMPPSGDALIELAAVADERDAAMTLQDLLELDPGARFDTGTINGLAAAFAAGAVAGRPVLASALRHATWHPAATTAAAKSPPLIVIAVQSRDPASYLRDRALLRTALNSARALTPDERGPQRQWRLGIVTLGSGMSLAQLAGQSPLGEHAAEVLRKLNRLPPKAELKAGQRLKIVQ